MPTDDRLTTLEIRYAHLERLVDELSRVVFDQHKAMEKLGKEVAVWRSRVEGIAAGPKHEPPPHY